MQSPLYSNHVNNEEISIFQLLDGSDHDFCLQIEAAQVEVEPNVPQQAEATSMVVDWLRNLGLSKFEEAFVREEIDWESLKCLSEEVIVSS